jgi:mannose-6-phosphate isomerase-like protein (cupin superfamily)
MSRLVKLSASKKHNMPDFKILGNVPSEISRKINDLILIKNENDIMNIIDHINSIVECKIYNVSVDTWTEPFESDWKRNSDYDKPTCGIFLVSNGTAQLDVDKEKYNLLTDKLCFVNEWCTHRLVSTSTSPLTMLLAQFNWDSNIHGK